MGEENVKNEGADSKDDTPARQGHCRRHCVAVKNDGSDGQRGGLQERQSWLKKDLDAVGGGDGG